jgi:hypothetical protein
VATNTDTAPSLTIVKRFNYRGDADEEFSNTYHFSGLTPADSATWRTFADAVIAQEKTVLHDDVSITRAYGHAPGNTIAVWTFDYRAAALEVLGTYNSGAGRDVPGDVAVVLRWSTANFTSRGKRIYLRKFYHRPEHHVTDRDKPDAGLVTRLNTYGAAWVTGIGADTRHIVGPRGAAGSSPVVMQWLTTRTLKRRGRRPSP